MDNANLFSRRRVLESTLALVPLAALTPAYAASLMPTPRQTAGPFYPLKIPLDSDNDLVTVKGREGRAKGVVTHLMGRVLDEKGRPVGGARVEIWQCDALGHYHHPRDRGGRGVDPGFQGYGAMVVGGDAGYRFRTIKPVPYPGRTPHIHFAVSGPGFSRLITQMYIEGHPLNAHDFVLNRIRDRRARESVLISFTPAPEIEPGALVAKFDIVLGLTGGLAPG